MVSVGLELGDLVGSRISGFRFQYFEVNAFCQEVVYTSEGIRLQGFSNPQYVPPLSLSSLRA